MFTFNVNNITSYELGRTQHGKAPDSWNTPTEETPPPADPMNSAVVNMIKEHHEDIQKVSSLPLLHINSPLITTDPSCVSRIGGSDIDHRTYSGEISLSLLLIPLVEKAARGSEYQ